MPHNPLEGINHAKERLNSYDLDRKMKSQYSDAERRPKRSLGRPGDLSGDMTWI
jgi:hypothetical protein